MAALAVTAPLPVPAAANEGIRKRDCPSKQIESGPAIWQEFDAPTFEAGLDVADVSQTVVSMAVSPSNVNNIAVTNENSIYVSTNGGCDFRMALRLDRIPNNPAIPLSGQFTKIRSVYIAPVTGTFFALAEEFETGASVGRPHVLRSETGAPNTWRLADEGLPPLGKPLKIEAAARGNVVYVTFRGAREESTCPPAPLPCPDGQNGERLGLMYASTNGGQTWSARTQPTELNSIAAIKYFSVDDDKLDGSIVWVVANGVLQRSADGGRTFDVPDGLDQGTNTTFTAVQSLRNAAKNEDMDLVAFTAEGRLFRYQRGRWTDSIVPFDSPVVAVSERPDGDFTVATSGRVPQLWRAAPSRLRDFESDDPTAIGRKLRATFGWDPITPGTRYPLTPAIQGGRAERGAGTYYAFAPRKVLRFLGSALIDPQPPGKPVQLDVPAPPTGKIKPGVLEFDLPVNGTRTVQYQLTLPESPTPLDVYFLVDNSNSMLPFIQDLKQNLGDVALALNRAKIDVGIGVGQINVQPTDKTRLPVDDPLTPDIDESKPKPIYKKLRDIGQVDTDLITQLQSLDGNAGSGYEPQLEALWQSVTGRGLSLNNLGYLAGYNIDPGQDAGWRDDRESIKVIVHATDEKFSTNIDPPDAAHNDWRVVAKTLKDAGIKQIGLSQGQPKAARDLKKMANATGATAPAKGTDCDGDGRIGFDDVKPYNPLVCGASTGLTETLVNLLSSLSDRQTITLSTKRSEALRAIDRTEFSIDAKERTNRRFTVTYSCRGLAPGSYSNDFAASLRGSLIAKAVTTVNCGGLTTPPRPQPAAELEPGSNPLPPQPPQPVLPAPVPLNPVPQPQTQVQAQSQVNPQGGMADQEEQQFQLATAVNDAGLRPEDTDQLAMSRVGDGDAAAGLVVALGMTLAGACAGVAYRRRSRTAAAKVTVRR